MDNNQLAVIHDFNDKYRKKFNPDLFAESDEGIIDEVKKVILSCQRETFFTIKVLNFSVVENYDDIINILQKYEKEHGHKNQGKDNVYDFINLKDSDIRLLVVDYYIAINDEYDNIEVLIAIPRSVDRYYYRINGNTYSALWQIVDASTYNSSTSNSKKHSVTLKTMFMPIRVYRYTTNHKNSLKDWYSGEPIICTFYTSYIFKKSLLVMKYILAKFGYYNTIRFLHLDLIDIYDTKPEEDSEYYLFNKNDIWIKVPKYVFTKDQVVQSFVYTLYNCINKSTTYNEFFSTDFWLLSLAGEFNNQNIEKGYSILDSLEFIYDITTKETLRLPYEMKQDIYHVLRWMMGEFSNLQIKDNLNVSIKRLRRAEYIASLYAMKLSTSIYRVSDIGKKANLKSIKKAIITNPMYLVNAISSCKLVNYRNFVGDLDSMVALKFTYKGISGIGEKSNSMPNIYRAINPSQIGKVDLDSSSAGDPGASGMLAPRAKVYSGGMFSEYTEPNTWDKSFTEMINNYKSLKGYKEAIIASSKLLGNEIDNRLKDELEESLMETKKLIQPIIKITESEEILDGLPLEESGLICYETLEDVKEE